MSSYIKTAMSIVGFCVLGLAITACGDDDDGDDDTEAADAGQQCDTLSVALFDSGPHRMVFHGIEAGIVDSDIIGDVQVSYLFIPALIEATGTDQYDIVQTALPGMVLAREGGLDLRIVVPAVVHQADEGSGARIFVRHDSDIEQPEDLVGKTLGVPSLGATTTTIMRLVLTEAYGIDAALEGGDLQFAELDFGPLVQAVLDGTVDAAFLFDRAAWEAERDEDLRVLVGMVEDYERITGTKPISSAFLAMQNVAEQKHPCMVEFRRMVEESKIYAEENAEEVAEEVAETPEDAAVLLDWITNDYDFGGTIDAEYLEMVEAIWELSERHDEIPPAPEVDEVVIADE